MKFNFLKFTFLLIIAISITSCDWLDTTSDVTTSDKPYFVSLTFASDEDNEGLSDASFTVEWDADLNDSIIVNLDSLPFKTDISAVIPTFKFQSTYAAYVYRNDSLDVFKDSIALTGSDTLDFRRVFKVKNIASDEKAKTSYRIKVNVHTVETELYVWNNTFNNLYTLEGSKQKGTLLNDSIFLYVGSGLNNSLYKSKNGTQWGSKINVPTLPKEAVLRDIQKFNNKLYLIHEGEKLFSSSDGLIWTSSEFSNKDYNFINLLFELNGKLWAIAKSKIDSKYRFAYTQDATNWDVIGEIPVNFPVGDFASLSFASRNNKPKALIAGGFSANGKLLSNVWSTEDGIYWVDFSRENSSFGLRAGSSIIHYDDKLLLFGGMDDYDNVSDKIYLESINEGLNWTVPDTTNNQIRQRIIKITADNKADTTYVKYEKRYQQSVILDKNNSIILIGGRNKSTVFSDVWVGKLTRLGFAK